MLTTQLHGQMIQIDVPGAPSVRLRASVALDLLGLSYENRTADLLALCGFLLFHLCLTTAIVSAKLRPPAAPCRGGGASAPAGRRGDGLPVVLARRKKGTLPVEAVVAALHEDEDDVPAYVLGEGGAADPAAFGADRGRRRHGARDAPIHLLADQDQVSVEMVQNEQLSVDGQGQLSVEMVQHGSGLDAAGRRGSWPHHDLD
jgi:hypothetical protein